jgi:hypothetical protein
MGMAENNKGVVDRKENKQRNFAQSETKNLVRSHNKNADNATGQVMRVHQSLEKDIMPTITAGAREKGNPVCGGGTTSKVKLDSR